jgi:hypothetical protein
MSDLPEVLPPPAARRDRSISARRAARKKRADREQQIMNFLNAGASIAEIPARAGVSERRMRMIVQEALARRMPQPPAEFVALRVSRLHEALLVSYSPMAGANLEAVDRYVRILRELDRYHGFAGRESLGWSDRPRLAAPPQAPLALHAPAALPEGNGAASD